MTKEILKAIEKEALKKYPIKMIVGGDGRSYDNNEERRCGYIDGRKDNLELIKSMRKELLKCKKELSEYQN